jgi:pyruvate formate lyase activating enzyme
MRIAGLQKCTLIDFPGKVAAIVFTQGCNFRCPYCHNSELWLSDCKSSIDEFEIFEFLKNRRQKLEGVVISGGEPLLQNDLPEFLRKIREMHFAIKLDTNGSLPFALEKLLHENLLDFVAMDLKHIFAHYNNACGAAVDVLAIMKSLNLLRNSGLDYELRITVVPTLHNLREIVEPLRKIVASVPRLVIQNFVNKFAANPQFRNLEPFQLEELEVLRAEMAQFVGQCIIR